MMGNFKNMFRRVKQDEDGATTFEFMIAMPLIIFWFAGSFTFFDAYSEWTRSVKATYTVADVMSRQYGTDDDYVNDMNSLFASIMGESPNNTYLQITSIEKASDNLTIDWSTASGLHTPMASDDDIPTEKIPNILNGESVLLIESNMPWVPFQSYVGLTAKTLTNQVVISPRFTPKLANSDQP